MATGARNQNRHTVIRKGAGAVIPAMAASRALDGDGPFPSILLDPTDNKVNTEHKSHFVLDASAKVAVANIILHGTHAIAAKLPNVNALTFLAALPTRARMCGLSMG